MGKDSQGLELAYELIAQKPTDLITLGNLDKFVDKASVVMFEEAFRIVPTEDIGSLWFFSVLRTPESRSLFPIALKLHTMFKGMRYLFWAILALHIQNRSPTASGKSELEAEKSMKLAEKMIIKAFSTDKVNQRSLEELLLLIVTLQTTENHADALSILDSATGISFPNLDEREIIRADLLEKSGKWEEAIEHLQEILLRRGIFDWTAWKLYVKAADNSVARSDLVKGMHDFIPKLEKQSDKRSLMLAKIDAGIVFKSDFCNEESLVNYILEYIEEFRDRGCCVPDMQHTSASLPVSVLEVLVERCLAKCASSAELLEITWHQLERIFHLRLLSKTEGVGAPFDPDSKISILETVLPKTTGSSEVLATGWLHLATLHVDRDAEGDLLKAAMYGTKAMNAAPDNFSAKLFLILVYLKLGSVTLALDLFRSLDVKQLQLDTLAYIISDHLLELGDLEHAELFFHESFFIYDENRTQSWSLIAEAFSRGSFSNVPEFYEFARRLEYSLQAVACICGTIRTELLTKDLEIVASYLEGLKPDDLLFGDEFMLNLSDNRDRDVVDFVDHAGVVKSKILNQLPTFGRTSILIYTFIPILLRGLLFDDANQLDLLVKKFIENQAKIESHPVSAAEATRLSFVQSLITVVTNYIESEKDAKVMIDGLNELLSTKQVVQSAIAPSYESISAIEWELERSHWIVLTVGFLIKGKPLVKNRKLAKNIANELLGNLEDQSSSHLAALGELTTNLSGQECPVQDCDEVWSALTQSFKHSITAFLKICGNTGSLLSCILSHYYSDDICQENCSTHKEVIQTYQCTYAGLCTVMLVGAHCTQAFGHFTEDFYEEMKKIAGELGEMTTASEAINVILGHLKDSCSQVGVHDQTTPYGILSPERADGTEGMVFMAPFRTASGTVNKCGIAYVLAAAKQYKKFKFWSRNFVILFPGIGMSTEGKVFSAVEKWLEAYHKIKPGISLSSGALQTGLSIELEGDQCSMPFGDPEVYLEGPDGLLPNLDVVNSLVMIERHRGGTLRLFPKDSFWYTLWSRISNNYIRGVVHAASMLVRQASGIVEITFRSLSNLLEHIHHSFFFYLLTDNDRYVSIMNYIAIGVLPIAGLLVCFFSRASRGSVLASFAMFFLTASINAAAVCGFSFSNKSPLMLILPTILLILFIRRVAPKAGINSSICLIAAVSLTAQIFLNFGLAVVLGLCYGPILAFAGRSPAWAAFCALCSPLMIFTILYASGNPWASFLADRLMTWNAGLPFILWQPLVLLACAGDDASPTNIRHEKQE
ncbi:hypothetical protein PSACC_02847 [Paramicrosporidium saccamoebae]|uniref:Uncharacterized protein n=1 Tax=Paramicrosporidium saccamoebae TaxID=1246581 RepID=A0A2H9TI02_9FUNG|nr:hypothetical protein PSACC_02847 [Paramicrosporidium saccamoebae]